MRTTLVVPDSTLGGFARGRVLSFCFEIVRRRKDMSLSFRHQDVSGQALSFRKFIPRRGMLFTQPRQHSWRKPSPAVSPELDGSRWCAGSVTPLLRQLMALWLGTDNGLVRFDGEVLNPITLKWRRSSLRLYLSRHRDPEVASGSATKLAASAFCRMAHHEFHTG